MNAPPPEPDARWLAAMLGGAVLAVALIGAGVWSTAAGSPLLWVFFGPWAFVGALLVLWGWQRRPRR